MKVPESAGVNEPSKVTCRTSAAPKAAICLLKILPNQESLREACRCRKLASLRPHPAFDKLLNRFQHTNVMETMGQQQLIALGRRANLRKYSSTSIRHWSI